MTDLERRLMAYADGELAPEEAAELEAELARRPELARRLRRYRESAALLRAAFPIEPVPPALEARVRALARRAAWRRRGRRLLPLAAALALGLVMGQGLRWDDGGAGDGELARVLSRVPSGMVGEGEILPTASYRTPEGVWCRSFERATPAGVRAGIACRTEEGGWRLRLWAELPAAAGGYAPASGGDPLAAAASALGLVPLGPEEERARLERD